MEQAKRRSLAVHKRFELRENARNNSRLYSVIVGVVALVIFIIRWL